MGAQPIEGAQRSICWFRAPPSGIHNSAAVTLLIAPTVAALGLIATVLVIRARYREKESLYESLRSERRAQIQKARQRALSGPVPVTPAQPVGPAPTPVRPATLVEPPSGIAAIRAQAIERGRLHNVAGLAALVVSLIVVLLGVLLAIVQSHTA